jgi:hypothetical protein
MHLTQSLAIEVRAFVDDMFVLACIQDAHLCELRDLIFLRFIFHVHSIA